MGPRVANAKYKINDYNRIVDCNTLTNTLLTMRPVGICLMVDTIFMSYISGVIPAYDATKKVGGHCVLLTGVKADGTTNVATNYWIVKNSWGTDFGEKGFMRLYRDPVDQAGYSNLCTSAIYSI